MMHPAHQVVLGMHHPVFGMHAVRAAAMHATIMTHPPSRCIIRSCAGAGATAKIAVAAAITKANLFAMFPCEEIKLRVTSA
jgi:proline racemase